MKLVCLYYFYLLEYADKPWLKGVLDMVVRYIVCSIVTALSVGRPIELAESKGNTP